MTEGAFFFRKRCGWAENFYRSMLFEIVNLRFAPLFLIARLLARGYMYILYMYEENEMVEKKFLGSEELGRGGDGCVVEQKDFLGARCCPI